MKKTFGDYSIWVGVNAAGELVKLRHRDLLEYMKTHYDKHAVESSTAYVFNGVRLVRGKYLVKAAINAGWDDLGKNLSEYYKETDIDDE